METRASYLLVGVFALLGMAGFAIAVVWMAGVNLREDHGYYDIYFTGSVTGLRTGNAVRYRGVPVGTVTGMEINPQNVEEVRVTVQVSAATPIKSDTVASLEMQGLTGVAYVQLTGGTQEAPTLTRKPGEKYPVIASKPSQLQELFEAAPELMARVITLVDRVTLLFSEENQENIEKTLANIGAVTEELALRKDDVGAVLTDTAGLMKELRAAAVQAENLMLALRRSTGPMADDAAVILGEIRQTAVEFRRASKILAELIEQNRDPVETFTSSGLYELTQLLAEMRVLVGGLTRISSQFEQDPARFLLGRGQPGLELR